MLDFLDKLRQKPTHIRQQIAVATTVILSGAIMMVWLNTWDIGRTITPTEEPEGISPSSVVVRRMVDLKESGIALWNNAITQVAQVAAVAQIDKIPEYAATGTPPQSAGSSTKILTTTNE